MIGDSPYPSEDSVRVQRDVANGVNPFLVALQKFVNRAAARTAEWCVLDQLQVRFSPDSHDRQTRREPQTALGLYVFDHGLAFEAVQVFTQQELDARGSELLGQPIGCSRIQKILQDGAVAGEHAEFGAATKEGGRHLRTQKTGADDDYVFFRLKDFAGGEHVAVIAKVNHIAQVEASHLRPAWTA